MRAKTLVAVGLILLPFSQADLIVLASGDTMEATIRGYEKQELVVQPTGATTEIRIPIAMIDRFLIRRAPRETREPVPLRNTRDAMEMTREQKRTTAASNRTINRYYESLQEGDRLKTDAYNLKVQADRLSQNPRDSVALRERALALLDRAERVYGEARQLQPKLEQSGLHLTRVPPEPDTQLRDALLGRAVGGTSSQP